MAFFTVSAACEKAANEPMMSGQMAMADMVKNRRIGFKTINKGKEVYGPSNILRSS
jgi:hypothetical protein